MKLTLEQVEHYSDGQIEIYSPEGHRLGSIENIRLAATAPILFVYLSWEAEERGGEWYAVKAEHITHEHMYAFDLTPFESEPQGDKALLCCKSSDTRLVLHPPGVDFVDHGRVHSDGPG